MKNVAFFLLAKMTQQVLNGFLYGLGAILAYKFLIGG